MDLETARCRIVHQPGFDVLGPEVGHHDLPFLNGVGDKDASGIVFGHAFRSAFGPALFRQLSRMSDECFFKGFENVVRRRLAFVQN
jgi:hypothetical protein